MNIPPTVFNNISEWMCKGPWPYYFQDVLDQHLNAFCDHYDIDTFEELAGVIGPHWVTSLKDVAFTDFLTRDTDDGNIVDIYLKKAGRKERVIIKSYLKGIRDSVMSLYEVSDIKPGESFMAEDLLKDGNPIQVLEKTATHTLSPKEHIAARIVDVRGNFIIAGSILPFKQDLSDRLIDYIHTCADAASEHGMDVTKEMEQDFDLHVIKEMSLDIAIRAAAPIISQFWLDDTFLNANETVLPSMCNSDGDPIELIHIHFPLKQGITELEVADILTHSEFDIMGDNIWGWVQNDEDTPSKKNSSTSKMKIGAQSLSGDQILATIVLEDRKIIAFVNSIKRAENVQRLLEGLLDGLVGRPLKEHQTPEQALKEFKSRGAQDSAPLDLSHEEQAEIMQSFYDQHYMKTLDEPVPMLNNKTPRQAARTSATNDDVVKWLEYLENQTAKQHNNSEFQYDFTWIWEELGLLDFRKHN